MEVSLKRSGIDCCNKIFSQTIRKEETQDAVVPDTMPDVCEILETTGLLLIRSKDISPGRVRLEACVAAKAAYLPEGEACIRCVDINVPVSISADCEEISEKSRCVADMSLIALETRMLNPRKLIVKAEVCARIDCYEETKIEYCSGVESAGAGINQLSRIVELSPISCVTEKTFVVTDEYQIPASLAPAGTVLAQRTELSVSDIKAVGSKLIFKGGVKSCILYNSTDGIPAAVEFTTSYSQIIETDGRCGSDPVARVLLMPSGAYYDISGGEGRTVSMELHLVAQALCSLKTSPQCLIDAYSNSYTAKLETASTAVECMKREVVLRESLRELFETQQPVLEVTEAYATYGVPEVKGGDISLPVTVCLIYKSGDGLVRAAHKRYAIDFKLELETGERAEVAAADVSDIYMSPAQGGAELRLPVELTVMVYCEAELRCICGISIDEDAPLDRAAMPSIVVMRAKSGDELWRVAKENGSTVEAIMQANGLEEDDGRWGKYILIPKTM